MKAYIAASYEQKEKLSKILDTITAVLQNHTIEPFVFINKYSFNASESKEMMQQAFSEIDQSAILIAEVSYKGIGIGIEAGYAKAKNIPVVYLRHADAAHSTTIDGICDHHIFYADIAELTDQLTIILKHDFFLKPLAAK